MKRILLPFIGCLFLAACSKIDNLQVSGLILQSPETITVSCEANVFEVKATHSGSYENIHASVLESGRDWLTLQEVSRGENDHQAVLTFAYSENKANQERETSITIFSDDSRNQIQIPVTQRPGLFFKLYHDDLEAPTDGGEVRVMVVSNIKFDINILPPTSAPDADVEWLKFTYWDNWNTMYFDVQPNKTGKDRAAFVQVVNPEDASVLGSFTFYQKSSGTHDGTPGDLNAEVRPDPNSKDFIKWAVDMDSNRLFPTWTNRIPTTPFNTPISNEEGSAEVLMFANWIAPFISTVMGVENNLLLRFGYAVGQGSDGELFLVTGQQTWKKVDYKFLTYHWYHIALTWKHGLVKVYVNGKECLSLDNVNVNVNTPWSYEVNSQNRCWWFGYSCNETRFLRGYMAEFRIWNIAITPEILHEKNHYYQLDMQKYDSKLLGYWKVDNSDSAFLENQVKHDNLNSSPLFGETDLTPNSGVIKGSAGIERVDVSNLVH